MIRTTVYTLLFFLFVSCSTGTEEVNPFVTYLNETEDEYHYEIASNVDGDGYTAYIIRMVSQNWLTDELVDEPEWWHWLTIVVPDEVDHQTGLLWIGGGTRNDSVPEDSNPMITEAALATNSITAELHNVPNQPISFHNDERLDERFEDDIIAYGWRKFLEGGARDDDSSWLSRYPMTTAAIRAMDTISEFSNEKLQLNVGEFVVSGASKRGWTAWYTAIFDERVVAVAPAVIDLLNMTPSFQHHWQAYGEWSPAISEYVDEGIMDWQFSVEYERLTELIDPYSYLDKLDMPKYIINAASDEFFLPDSWQFYWDDLPGHKYLRYIPNTGHSISETDAPVSLISFYNQIVHNDTIPAFSWSVSDTGFELQFDPENLPDEILLWNSRNPDGRDFRLYVIDRIWLAQDVELNDDGSAFVNITAPDEGFTAWFVEATYDIDSPLPFKTTTGVTITPDEYPYPEYQIENPPGTHP